MSKHLPDDREVSAPSNEIDAEDLSLKKLSEAYAGLLGTTDSDIEEESEEEEVVFSDVVAPGRTALPSEQRNDDDAECGNGGSHARIAPSLQRKETEETGEPEGEIGDAAADPHCEITPRSLLEAMLFVGNPEGGPLSARKIASRLRGVSPKEVSQLADELNATYAVEGCPYAITSTAEGYRLVLREEFAGLRDKFYGRVRQARLSQSAVDVLALVAYQQPLTREQVDHLRGKSSSAILSQLVRRKLLRIERPDEKPRVPRYFTTDRFLQLFGLETLQDLPQHQEMESE